MRRDLVLKTCARGAAAILLVWLVYALKGNIYFRLYPAVIVAIAFCLFARSLFTTPLIEVFARRMGESLDERGRVVCRQLTRLWTGFLALHFLVTCATVFMPLKVWAFYNGALSYVLLGTLFAFSWTRRPKGAR